jgi:hypothetical protein
MFIATAGDHEAQEITLNYADSASKQGNDETFSSAYWLVVNESAGGLALCHAPGAQNSVRVGDLLGLRSDQVKHWSIGVVRRVSVDSANKLEIGIQMLAPTAKPAAVRPIDRAEFEIALMLPELSALRKPASLVTSRGLYQPARVLDVDQNGTVTRVMATKLIERTNSFERFQYSHFDS